MKLKALLALGAATAALSLGAVSPVVQFIIPSGRPGEAEVRAQVRDLKAHAYDQFLVYPSTGLDYEYLSEDFFTMMGWYLDEAEKLGMKVWLYDEFNWPSGTARGKVPAELEAARYRELIVKDDGKGGFVWEIIVSNEINLDNYCLDGNNFEPVSVRRFMELTHLQYEKHFKDKLGTVIPAIFSDEPGHCSSAWRMKMPSGTRMRFPYWSGLEDEYRELCGGDFRQDVEAELKAGAKSTGRVFRTWAALRSRRYRKTFFDPIAAWCRKNGIVSTGHLLGEEGAPYCTRINGTPLNTLKGLMKPGIDLIFSNFESPDYEWLTLAFAQAGVKANGRGGIAELFALGPCDITFARMRTMYWLCALHGIDIYLQSLHHTSARRFNIKDSWAMFTSPTQPWYDEMPLLHEEAKQAAAFAKKPAKCSLAVVYPASAAGAAAFFDGVKTPDLRGLAKALSTNGFNYDLIEEDEETAMPYVLDWDGVTLFERKRGLRFGDFEALLKWLDGKAGKREKNTIKREYLDGSVVRVDVISGRLKVEGQRLNSGISPSAKKSEHPLSNLQPPTTNLLSQTAEWQLKLNGPSRRRVWFWRSKVEKQRPWGLGEAQTFTDKTKRYEADDMAKFVCEEPLKGVRFVLCDYPPERKLKVTLDGKPLAFPIAPAKSLVYAYNEICRESEPLELAKGEHVLKLEGGHDGKLFLPALWMVGDFSEPAFGRLCTVPLKVALGSLAERGLAAFAGCAVYRTEARFKKGEQLKADTGGAVARVRFGGRDLGARGWAPFEWEIPEDLAGKTLPLEIEIKTSVRPIFGSEKCPDAKLDHSLWVAPAEFDPSPTGLRSVWRCGRGELPMRGRRTK